MESGKKRKIYKWTENMRAVRQQMRESFREHDEFVRKILDDYFDTELTELEARVTKLELQMKRSKPKKRATPKKRVR